MRVKSWTVLSWFGKCPFFPAEEVQALLQGYGKKEEKENMSKSIFMEARLHWSNLILVCVCGVVTVWLPSFRERK